MPSADALDELAELVERFIIARHIAESIGHGALDIRLTFSDRTHQLTQINIERKRKPKQTKRDLAT